MNCFSSLRSLLWLLASSACTLSASAQYAPQVGLSGSTAIYKDSAVFVGWATDCTVSRGLQQIGVPTSGDASLGNPGMALGKADGQVVSLGDSGVAVLHFASPITDKPGPDFAVFENGFLYAGDSVRAFLELAFVEVSSDGVHFTRFPASSRTQDSVQISPSAPPSLIDAREINNLAGKYLAGWGTPFDLQELADSPNLNIERITTVRIVDVVGSIGAHASLDHEGRKINDPFPSPFPSSGFDLDAVGVIHQIPLAVGSVASQESVRVFPNPAHDFVRIQLPEGGASLALYDLAGRKLQSKETLLPEAMMDLRALPQGIYFLQASSPKTEPCRVRILHY